METCAFCGWGPVEVWYNKIIEQTYIDRREKIIYCDRCHAMTVKKEPGLC
jgi:hypothetical protein